MNNKISDAEKTSNEIIERLAKATSHTEVERLTKEYVKTRYFLNDQDLEADSFNALGQLSIARSTGLDLTEVPVADLSMRCDGHSSSMTKKILLMMSLNKALDLRISPEQSAETTTLTALTAHISKVILKRNAFL